MAVYHWVYDKVICMLTVWSLGSGFDHAKQTIVLFASVSNNGVVTDGVKQD